MHTILRSGLIGAFSVALVASTSHISAAWGAQVVWLGGDGDWSDPGKWSTGTVPKDGDDVVLANGKINLDGIVVSPRSISTNGGTLLNGTLRIAPGAIDASAYGELKNVTTQFLGNGILQVDDDFVLNGTTVASQGLDKTGAGRLFNWGQYQGDITISEGQFVVEYGGLVTGRVHLRSGAAMDLGGSIGSLAGEGYLYLRGGASVGADGSDSEFSGSVSGSGQSALEKIGEGTFTFSGASVQDFKVQQGTLILDGAVNADVDVNGGVLGGTGEMWVLNANSGSIAPGRGIGSLEIQDLNFGTDAIYQVDITTTGEHDKLTVTNEAVLSGGTVNVIAKTGRYTANTTYNILTAANGLSGQFDAINSDFAFLDADLSYDANNAYLTLLRNDVSMYSIGYTLNQKSVGRALDSNSSNFPFVDEIIGMSGDGARAAYDQLSGEAYASASAALVADSASSRALISSRMARVLALSGDVVASSSDDTSTERQRGRSMGGWAQAYGGTARLDGDDGVASTGFNSGGLGVGIDGELGDWFVGMMANVGTTDIDVDGLNTSLDSRDYGFGIYGGREWNRTALIFGAHYNRHSISSTRGVDFGAVSERLSADYHATTTQAYGEVSHNLDLDAATLTPFANVAVVHQNSSDFSERGGTSALSVDDSSRTTTFTTLGVKAERQVALGNSTQLVLRGEAGWQHAFSDSGSSTHSFSDGTAFEVVGAEPSRNSIAISSSVGFLLPIGANFDIGYRGSFSASQRSQALTATLAGKF